MSLFKESSFANIPRGILQNSPRVLSSVIEVNTLQNIRNPYPGLVAIKNDGRNKSYHVFINGKWVRQDGKF